MLLNISILDFLLSEVIIVSLVLTAIGFACALLAPRIVKKIKGKDYDVNQSKSCLVLRCMGLCLMVVGILIIGIVCFKGTLNI